MGYDQRQVYERYGGTELPNIAQWFFHRTPEMVESVKQYHDAVPRWIRGSRPYMVDRQDEFQVALDEVVSRSNRGGWDLEQEYGYHHIGNSSSDETG